MTSPVWPHSKLNRGRSHNRPGTCSGFLWSHSSCSCHNSHLWHTRIISHYSALSHKHHFTQQYLMLHTFSPALTQTCKALQYHYPITVYLVSQFPNAMFNHNNTAKTLILLTNLLNFLVTAYRLEQWSDLSTVMTKTQSNCAKYNDIFVFPFLSRACVCIIQLSACYFAAKWGIQNRKCRVGEPILSFWKAGKFNMHCACALTY